MKRKLKIITTLVLIALANFSCSNVGSDGQFTNKAVAPQFVTRQYDTVSKVVTVAHDEASHIAWLGFVQSNDYKYFKITRVQLGSQVIAADGMTVNGSLFTPTSNASVSDITVPESQSDGAIDINGSLSTDSSQTLQITVQYSPLNAIESETHPHTAYLLVSYDEPDHGYMRIELQGFTQGMKNEKCTRPAESMTLYEYQLVNSAIDLYFCSAQVAINNQNNTTQDSADPDFHGLSTNLVSVPFPTDVIPIYQVDEETVCLLSGSTPTIPDFTLPIPPGLSPISSMEVGMMDNSYAECTLDESGNIFCDEGILIDSLVSTSGFSLSNTGFTAEQTLTTDCPDFGAIAGSGTFGEDMTVMFLGTTLADMQTTQYNIVDSLIVGVMNLKAN